MGYMFNLRVRVYKDVIQVSQHVNIQEIQKNIIHKPLESGRGISKSERHNTPFKRPISGLESSFPFITFCYSDQVIGMMKIDFCIYLCFSWRIEQVTDEGKRISVLFGVLVQA